MDEEQAPEPLMPITEAVLRASVTRQLRLVYLGVVLESQPLDVCVARRVGDTWKTECWRDWEFFKLGYLIHKRLREHGSFYYPTQE